MLISVIGCGYLGAVHAAAMASLGHEVVGVDVDEAKIGTTIGALTVSDLSELATWPDDIDLVVMAVPASAAPAAARIAADAGVRGILNFAPTVLETPDSVRVRQVDLASELQVLAYYSALDDNAGTPVEEHSN